MAASRRGTWLLSALGLGTLLLGAGAGCAAEQQAWRAEPMPPATYSAEPAVGVGLEVQNKEQARACRQAQQAQQGDTIIK